MKYILIFICIFSFTAFAQFDIDLDLEKKIEKKVNKEINDAADDAIDETAETIKKGGSEGGSTEGEKNSETDKTSNTNIETDINQVPVDNQPVEELKIWSKYSFVAGDKIIFEDDLIDEESGEFPSRWDLLSGSAEVASLGEDNVIHLTHNYSIILPLMDKTDFLSDVFTIEFDVYFEKDGVSRSDFYKIRFF